MNKKQEISSFPHYESIKIIGFVFVYLSRQIVKMVQIQHIFSRKERIESIFFVEKKVFQNY